MAAEIALGVLLDRRLALRVHRDRPGALELADERVPGLDAAVEDANPNSLAGRALQRPVARNAVRPLERHRDAVDRVSRQGPRGKAFFLFFLFFLFLRLYGFGLGHCAIVVGSAR